MRRAGRAPVDPTAHHVLQFSGADHQKMGLRQFRRGDRESLDQTFGRLLRREAADKAEDEGIGRNAERLPDRAAQAARRGLHAIDDDRQLLAWHADRPGMGVFVGGDADHAVGKEPCQAASRSCRRRSVPLCRGRDPSCETHAAYRPAAAWRPGSRIRESAPALELWPWMMSKGPCFRIRRSQICRGAEVGQARRAGHVDRVDAVEPERDEFSDEALLGAPRRIDRVNRVAALLQPPTEIDEMAARAAAARFEHLQQAQGPRGLVACRSMIMFAGSADALAVAMFEGETAPENADDEIEMPPVVGVDDEADQPYVRRRRSRRSSDRAARAGRAAGCENRPRASSSPASR